MGEAIGSTTNCTHEDDGALDSAAHATRTDRLVTPAAIELAERILNEVRSDDGPLADSSGPTTSVSPERRETLLRVFLGDNTASSRDSSST